MTKSYVELGSEGCSDTLPGKGVLVARRREVLSKTERRRRLREALRGFLREATCEGFDAGEIRAELEAELTRRERKNKRGRS